MNLSYQLDISGVKGEVWERAGGGGGPEEKRAARRKSAITHQSESLLIMIMMKSLRRIRQLSRSRGISLFRRNAALFLQYHSFIRIQSCQAEFLSAFKTEIKSVVVGAKFENFATSCGDRRRGTPAREDVGRVSRKRQVRTWSEAEGLGET